MAQRKMVTVREAARRLGGGYYAVYKLMLDGALKGERVAGRWVVDAADLDRLVRTRAGK
jgi:excisionase family DNA binding protein